MLTIPHVFSSNALFQGKAPLVIRGFSDPDILVSGTIFTEDGTVFSQANEKTNADGTFALSLTTPAPSFTPYRIRITAGEDEHLMENVLFGELWLASGQSNMEMANVSITGCEAMYREAASKIMRIYHVESKAFPDGGFPKEPYPMQDGCWILPDDAERLAIVSALGLRFTADLCDALAGRQVPVGLLNASWGGTGLPCWLPLDAMDEDEEACAVLKRVGGYPDLAHWNEKGDLNFQQPTSQYNLKIAGLLGVKVRGILWYQGENETGAEPHHRFYADYLRFYHKVYRERFAADPEHFLMISSLIYPWTYGSSGECCVGYINDAFIRTALEEPHRFAYTPIGDLPPVWSYHQGNHPIHPGHKYEVGHRMAQIAIHNVYGGEGQKTPGHLVRHEISGDRMILHFASVGSGLRVGQYGVGEDVHGLYLAGEDGVYLPAECRILAPDTMEVFCDGIDAPKHAAYGIQSLEPQCNLYAGDFPLTPFFTDRKPILSLEQKQWYDTAVTSLWGSKLREDVLDLFFHPVWHPAPDSEVCHDTAFRLQSRASVRVCSEEETFGCHVRSYPYHRIVLKGFSTLRVSLYNTAHLTASLTVEGDGFSLALPLTRTEDLTGGWSRWTADLTALPDGEIARMGFRFTVSDSPYRFVNLERIRLYP